MAEKFRFMDPVQLPDGTYDREYNAQEFTDYFKALVTTGVMKSVGNQLSVSANGANMVTRIDTGLAFILGRYYENDSFKEHTHDTETLGNSRIDRIVIRMDLSPDKRSVLSYIKKGAPSPNPVPPVLTQTANVYEISLAQVRVIGGQTFIATDAVTDERGTNVICPWAGSNLLPSFDDNELANHINNTDVHLQNGERDKINNASNHINDTEKHLRVGERDKWNHTNNSLFSRFPDYCSIVGDWNDATLNGMYMAAEGAHNSPNGSWNYGWVIAHNDIWIDQFAIAFTLGGRMYRRRRTGTTTWTGWVEQPDPVALFTSVSNGKSLVANAITQKGVNTSPTAEFATMAINISRIQTGKKFAKGKTSSQNVGGKAYIIVSGLDFHPEVIVVSKINSDYSVYKGIYASRIGMGDNSAYVDFATHLSNGNIQVVNPVTTVGIGNGKFEMAVSMNYDGNSSGLYTWAAYG